jgi:hypothetical protein
MTKSLFLCFSLCFLFFKTSFAAVEKPLPNVDFFELNGGAINLALFQSYQGVVAKLPGFDFNAKCDILSYQIVVLRRRNDPVTINNNGWKFNNEANAIFSTLKPGDMVSFLDIKTMCPGDNYTRNLGSLSYVLK